MAPLLKTKKPPPLKNGAAFSGTRKN